jgi:hypothetical protein
MKPLSYESRALLEAARGREEPSVADRARVRSKISVRMAAGLALGSAVTASATVAEAAHVTGLAAAAAWLPATVKVVAVSLVASGITVSAVHMVRNASPSANRVATVSVSRPNGAPKKPAPAITLPKAQSPMAVPALVETAREPSRSVAIGKAPPATKRESTASNTPSESPALVEPSATDDALSSQVSAIRNARAAIRSGNGAAALTVLNRAFVPGQSGPLAQEAALVRVSALCLAGDISAARRTAEWFLENYPTSPLCSKVRSTCAFP